MLEGMKPGGGAKAQQKFFRGERETTRQKLRSEWYDNDDANRVHNHFMLFPPGDGRSPSLGSSEKADYQEEGEE